jgi:iron-sulfur cluster repair protein YtfE (RIC family)
MELHRHISRRLHEEHEATLVLWSRVEASLAANRPDASLLKTAAAALAEELDRHFAFEEAELFPRLAAAGEADIGLLLADEHATIREIGREFMALVKSEPGNPRLRVLGLELAERLVSHVQKEEMSLLPSLDDLLDEDADQELSACYAAA